MPLHRSGFARLQHHLLPVLLLIGVTVALYGKILGHDFLVNWDDPLYVTDNEAIRGFSGEHLKLALTQFYGGNYAPLPILSYLGDFMLWGGLKPAGFFFTNLLLHALNGLMFYFLLVKLSGSRLWGFVAALLFLAHPVQVESVAWISQRKNLLSMFFFLPAFYLYILYRERGWAQGKSAYFASLVAFFLSLMAKSVTVILPPLLLLFDLCYGDKRKLAKQLPDKLPYVLAAGLFAWISVLSQDTALTGAGGRVPYHGGSPFATFLTMLPVFVRYVAMLFWPVNLSASYAPPIKTGMDLEVALAALVLLLFAVCGFFLYRQRRELFFWFAFFFVGLLPVSQIVPLVTLMNDRYLYFPMLGAAALGGAMVVAIHSSKGWRRNAGMAAAIYCLLALPWLSFSRVDAWQNTKTLWSDVTIKNPEIYGAWTALGDAYVEEEQYDKAFQAFLRAYTLNPNDFLTRKNLGYIYTQIGQVDKGREILLKLATDYPSTAEAVLRLAGNYFFAGDLPKAEAAYQRALTLEPGSAEALNRLGTISLKNGKIDEAITFFQKTLTIDSLHADTLNQLGILYTTKGKTALGRSLLLRLTRSNPRNVAGFINLGSNYYLTGDFPAAEQAYKSALTINPRSAKALGYLGNVYLRTRQLDAARQTYLAALQAGADKGEMEYNLACTESVANRPGPALDHLKIAVSSGFRDQRRLTGNRELAPLRNHPDFLQLVQATAEH
jgi:tetratricopeptide (TPR) repeat protein